MATVFPYSVLIMEDQIIASRDGKITQIPSSHESYEEAEDAYRRQDADAFQAAIDTFTTINTMGDGRFTIGEHDTVTFTHVLGHQVAVPDSIAERVIHFAKRKLPATALEAFCDRLFENPSAGVVSRLFAFLEANRITLLPDGKFLGYKKVGPNYESLYSGKGAEKFDNSPGLVVEVPRNKVDDNHEKTCSYGLHVSAFDYASRFASRSDNKLVEVAVDPRDVVSVPPDYNNQKIRCCRYNVIRDCSDRIQEVEDAYYEPDDYDWDDPYDDWDDDDTEADSYKATETE